DVYKRQVHGLGHGLGLDVHEPPRLSALSQKHEPLKPGFVFTVEPGLYFPDKGYGVRLEDVVAIHSDGKIENLTPFSKEILIPLR
ncbi:MAG: M24 family metallopeptidase, partial [Planctomycetota bacterium]|nr:M24 family metallopeptidase [Planctomycetota bacterium]